MASAAGCLLPRSNHDPVEGGIEAHHMQRFPPGHPQSPPLADGEMLDAIVLADHRSVLQNDLALTRRQIGVEERLHRAVVIGQAEILALGLGGGPQTETLSLLACFALAHLTEGKDQFSQHLLGEVVEEVALVLAGIQPPQQLVPATPISGHRQRLTSSGMADPGVMASGETTDLTLGAGPGQHRAELDLPVAAGTGQGGDPAAIAIQQEINDLALEVLAEIHHMVGNPQLLTDGGCVHQAFGTAGALAAHQPQGETLHLPAGLHQQGGREGAVDPPGEAHHHAVIAGPGPQSLQARRPGGGGGYSIGVVIGNGEAHRQDGERTERLVALPFPSHHGSLLPLAAVTPRPDPSRCWPRRDADHLLLRGQQMAELEAELFASGLPVEALMEKAALAVSRRLLALQDRGGAGRIPAEGVVVLVGPGHNGGDGLVVARELHLAGIPVRLWSPFQRRKPLTEQHWRHARWLGIPMLVDPPPAEGTELWIDALFGNGQTRAPGPEIEALLEARKYASRDASRALVAIDVPTGLCSDSGALLGSTAARADLTLCIGLWKRGLVQDLALSWVGRLERVDLGLPRRLLEHLPADQPLGLGGPPADPASDAQGDDWEAPRPVPDPAAGKYDRGRLLVIAGSARYRGAGHLALAGASASGCGSLRAALPPEMGELLWMVHPHVVLEEPPLGPSHFERLDAVLVGPGLGPRPEAQQPGSDRPLVEPWWDPLQRFPGLLVLDADGLNRVTPVWLSQRQGPTWITPHGGEFGRLFPDLAAFPPLEAAAKAARRTGVTVLLKGARSVIAAADGRRWQLLQACGGAARAGLGDVLAGYAAGLGSRSSACGCLDGALLAVAALDHALAGCRCTELHGPGGATPQAIAAALAWAPQGSDPSQPVGKTVIHPANPG